MCQQAAQIVAASAYVHVHVNAYGHRMVLHFRIPGVQPMVPLELLNFHQWRPSNHASWNKDSMKAIILG
jgi:hypothetical protein